MTGNSLQLPSEGSQQLYSDTTAPKTNAVEGIKGNVETLLLDPQLEAMSSQSIEVEVFPGRGGLIKSIKIGGVEILYQDMFDETLLDTSKSVKGGIPYMFPNAGPLTNKEKEKSGINLPQHGIARVSPWTRNSKNKSPRTIQQDFVFTETPEYPYSGNIKNFISDEPNGVKIVHVIGNNGETNMPIASGLHPYFRVPQGKKEEIIWNFPGGDKISKEVESWSNDGTVTFENPHPGKPFSIIIPGLGRLELTASADYKKFWVWSLPGKDFVCIEPVMGDEGMIANNPVIIEPGKTNSSSLRINLFQES